ncbi:MAG: DUF4339 domain-containing protein [Verrucomicrobia bacterium]|nr:DUF4339 domain-containing protein [Verrucomicrobiota bacterium]
MNYRIIGGDQKEYGPITTEQLRQWYSEGRVNAQTQVQAEGETGWRPLASYPELMPLTAGAAPTIGPAASPLVTPIDPQSQIKTPAVCLLITGILGCLLAAAGIVMNALGATMGSMGHRGGGEAERVLNMVFGGLGVVQSIIHVGVAGVIIFGALKMQNLVNYRLAMATSILALAPCISPCCLLGMPFGIWALVVLNKPEVKAAFH